MGVPAFFRWISRKYPLIIIKCVEDKPKNINGIKIPIDTNLNNPNGVEFDNLYLDMNGIIHPCCHPENKPAPTNEDEMMNDIFDYIDRIFAIVRPRRLIYMAIDGVAPRAKMNQQRSRRFRAAKESEEKLEQISKIKKDLKKLGLQVPPNKPKDQFDSNCITPGTEFMFRLAECLRYYIHQRLNTDPGWKNIAVILSDANVPGEGEHKIMDFIRRQRSQPNYDSNTRHCFCGADADLIMLGMATHEPYFTIIREEFKPNQPRNCEICCQQGHDMQDCMGLQPNVQNIVGIDTEFIFIKLDILRKYLYDELKTINPLFSYDGERAIDDWVLLCFFVGNDFLPHIPSLEIHEGAIDRLVTIYKKFISTSDGYLTDSGTVNFHRLQYILTELGGMEDDIFKKRRITDLNIKRREIQKCRIGPKNKFIHGEKFMPFVPGNGPVPLLNPIESIREARKAAIKCEPEVEDKIKLWEPGWNSRYYIDKFGIDTVSFRRTLGHEYIIGIYWVLQYYYQGCASWDWYYPHYYAPFASDFVDIDQVTIKFPLNTKPFKPLEQLMSVLPAASRKFLPPTWQDLMINPNSPIIDFYPKNFKIDLNGKKHAWQGVALLPFVDKKRLFNALKTVYPDLTEYEKTRNKRTNDRLLVGSAHKSHDFLENLYKLGYCIRRVELNDDIKGTVWCDKEVVLSGETVISPIPDLEDVYDNSAISVMYRDPQYDVGYIFPARLINRSSKSPSETFVKIYKPRLGFTKTSNYNSETDPATSIKITCGRYRV